MNIQQFIKKTFIENKKVIGFQRIGSGDWYILDDGTKVSTGDGDRILRLIRTIDNDRQATHLIEAMQYIVSAGRQRLTKAFYNLSKNLNRD